MSIIALYFSSARVHKKDILSSIHVSIKGYPILVILSIGQIVHTLYGTTIFPATAQAAADLGDAR